MNANPMKVGEIAKQLGVTTNTVRNWCRRYAESLSESANPPGGGERLFTTQDVNVLAYIQSAMNEGMNHAEIAVRLGEKEFSSAEVETIVPTPGTSITTHHQPPQDAPDSPAMLPAVLQGIDSRFQAIERRIEAQAVEAKATQSERINILITGIVIGAVLVLIIVAVALGMAER